MKYDRGKGWWALEVGRVSLVLSKHRSTFHYDEWANFEWRLMWRFVKKIK